MTAAVRKKLIEVSIPLEAINSASAREKSIRHGHPSTLHLWWARRPLAACRAVLFAQLVDDPSAWPDRFPSQAAQDVERRRLHKVIESIVPWEASNSEAVLNVARWEIARSIAWGLGEEPPPPNDSIAILAYLQTKGPPVYDPFSGGGSIPLEAQRLGLRAYGSDLNPVAVLIGKALVEIPSKFAGLPPVNPDAQAALKKGGRWNSKGTQGLADDVRYYGQWMRDEAERRIGHLYPKATLPGGSEATVIAWLWARTVRSPDPAAKGAMVPLVSSFMLSTKEGKKAWIEPVMDPAAQDGWRFEVHTGPLSKADEARLKEGTKTGRGTFVCIKTGTAITNDHIKREFETNGPTSRLIAIVAEGDRQRIFLPATDFQTQTAAVERPDAPEIAVDLAPDARALTPILYKLDSFDKLFSDRQLVGLLTFSDLVADARERIKSDLILLNPDGGVYSEYADDVSTYLALTVSKMSDYASSLCAWRSDPKNLGIGHVFSRQALPMVWDYCEANPFSASSGNWLQCLQWLTMAIPPGINCGLGQVSNIDAAENDYPVRPAVVSTDPPYYDNIGYSDLSDFFYVWLRRSLSSIWPNLFRRITAPKREELVATPYRQGGRAQAERFFMEGMGRALTRIGQATTADAPITIYYAFKQSEIASEGITSSGWASFLQAIIDAGLLVDGTWPIRTEMANRTRGIGSNALASSVVLVCRRRPPDAAVIARADFMRLLKRELPEAIDAIRKAGVGPVDMQQSVIGPGMGVFSRHGKVLEDDDAAMSVKTALALINRAWEEIENELDTAFDPETQVALAWYATYGFDARPSGELITLANAKNTPSSALFGSGVFTDGRGKASLTERTVLPDDWTPETDKHLTVWECVQHTARVLNAADGGAEAAARLVAQMGPKAADARALAYRLFEIATQKGWSAEALVYNELAEDWTHLEDIAAAPQEEVRKGDQGVLSFS